MWKNLSGEWKETCENHYPNRRTAHAEMYCMRNIDIMNYGDFMEK